MKKYEKEHLVEMLEQDGLFSKEIGICIEIVEDDYARGAITVCEKHLNPMGMVHGGCIYALADTVAGVAASAHGNFVVTVSGSLNYLEAAIHTKRIIAEAHQLRFGRHMIFYEVAITNDDGELLAKGDFSYYNTGNIIQKEVTDEKI